MTRSIVVTGGFGALGRSVARAAVGRGWRVALVELRPESPGELAAELGEEALLLGGVDLTDAGAARRAMDEAQARLGTLQVLVNAAGGFTSRPFEDGGAQAFGDMHRINLATALNASAAALPHLLASGSGRIVNLGASAAVKAGAGMGAYAASKAAVHRLTESLAEELKDRGVTVNAVLPSILDTPANRADMPDADFARWVSPDDLAKVILFLASEDAAAVTGALLPVTGRG